MIRSQKALKSLLKLIISEELNDLSLTIYYMSPLILTLYPWSVDDLIRGSEEQKIVVKGNALEENICTLKQLNNVNLIPVKKTSSYINARIYYVFRTEKKGRLLDVAMWGGAEERDSIFVNGHEVEENDIFYNVIIHFIHVYSLKLFK